MLEDVIRDGHTFLPIRVFKDAVKASVMDLPITLINEFIECMEDDTRDRKAFYEEYKVAMTYVLPIISEKDTYQSLLLATMGPAVELLEIFINKGEDGLKHSESYIWFTNNVLILVEQFPDMFPVDPAVLDKI